MRNAISMLVMLLAHADDAMFYPEMRGDVNSSLTVSCEDLWSNLFPMNYSQSESQSSVMESNQQDPAVQAALFICNNGVSLGKDHLSKVASCFECTTIPKSTFIAEEGLIVCLPIPLFLMFLFQNY